MSGGWSLMDAGSVEEAAARPVVSMCFDGKKNFGGSQATCMWQIRFVSFINKVGQFPPNCLEHIPRNVALQLPSAMPPTWRPRN